MKTALIAIDTGIISSTYACGLCFAISDRDDKFCSKCGAEYVVADYDTCHAKVITNYNSLKEINESEESNN